MFKKGDTVYVLDVSGSMRRGTLQTERLAVSAFRVVGIGTMEWHASTGMPYNGSSWDPQLLTPEEAERVLSSQLCEMALSLGIRPSRQYPDRGE